MNMASLSRLFIPLLLNNCSLPIYHSKSDIIAHNISSINTMANYNNVADEEMLIRYHTTLAHLDTIRQELRLRQERARKFISNVDNLNSTSTTAKSAIAS